MRWDGPQFRAPVRSPRGGGQHGLIVARGAAWPVVWETHETPKHAYPISVWSNVPDPLLDRAVAACRGEHTGCEAHASNHMVGRRQKRLPSAAGATSYFAAERC